MTPAILKTFQYVVPAVSFIVMSFWPAAITINFTVTTLFSTLQVFVLQAPWYRKWRNLQPFMQSPNSGGGATQSSYKGVITTTARSASANVSEPEASQKGFLGGAVSEIKGALKQTTKRAKTMVNESSGKRTEAEKKAAQKYEERRQKEIEQERFEAKEEKQRRREERRQKQQE